jgi:hypothetical protein
MENIVFFCLLNPLVLIELKFTFWRCYAFLLFGNVPLTTK